MSTPQFMVTTCNVDTYISVGSYEQSEPELVPVRCGNRLPCADHPNGVCVVQRCNRHVERGPAYPYCPEHDTVHVPEPEVHLSIEQVLSWIRAEKMAWAGEKYSYEDEDKRTKAFAIALSQGGAKALDGDTNWMLMASNYLSRAATLGLETPRGKQAIMKYAAAAVALAASTIRVFGEPPAPGVPSGEIVGEEDG